MTLVRDLMHRGVVTCNLQTSVREIAKIMDANWIRCVVVTDDQGEVWGVVSLISILKAWGKDLDKLTAEDILQPYTVTVSPDTPIENALNVLRKKRIEHLVIVSPRGRRAVGILTTFDIVQHIAGVSTGVVQSGLELKA